MFSVLGFRFWSCFVYVFVFVFVVSVYGLCLMCYSLLGGAGVTPKKTSVEDKEPKRNLTMLGKKKKPNKRIERERRKRNPSEEEEKETQAKL